MKREIKIFIERYVNELRDDNAGIFVGAGMSKSSGYVDWKGLLKGIAEEIELDVERESDLVTLAQYHTNEHQGRSIINDIIYKEFCKDVEISENHRILARLPIFSYWTTNYDSLIEDALVEANRIVDIKYDNEHLSITRSRRDAIVYKMHGDKTNPNQAILIKDDYERYFREHAPFITALSGDLVSKTFLFVGFSFTDPNIDYILNRIRVEYGTGNRKQHYALMRAINRSDYEQVADYDYDYRKQQLFINDLKRYSVKVLLIEEYSEITDIFREIERQLNYNRIFISGSAEIYGDEWDEGDALGFIEELSRQLIQKEYNIVSGFGLGVGSSVITGALKEIYLKNKTINNDRLLLRPFPQGIENSETRKRLWRAYREDMLSRTGIAIFVFGNKNDRDTGKIVLADGVYEEYEVAQQHGNLIIPIGCTGFIAEKIWNEINSNINDFYPGINDEQKEAFLELNRKGNYQEVINNILNFIKKMGEI